MSGKVWLFFYTMVGVMKDPPHTPLLNGKVLLTLTLMRQEHVSLSGCLEVAGEVTGDRS